MDFRHAAGLHDLIKSGMRVGHQQILVNRVGEQHGFLRHHAITLTHLVGRKMADVTAVDLDAAVLRRIKPLQQLGQRAFTATRGAGNHREPAGLQRQRQVAIQVRMFIAVAKRQPGNVNAPCTARGA